MKSKIQSRSPDEAESVFYEAFRYCDHAVMAALWGDGDVICIHPGSPAIIGYEAVSRSWASIFGNAGGTNIRFSVARRTETPDLAVHLVVEEMLDHDDVVATVLATNVYRRVDNSWLMIEHHGSVVQVEQQQRTLQ